ncbi:type II toxin-antitoxin system Phd/YefM family antitoxin [Planctomonas deserti]|uniref:type II toxin-antitoxin system Phd/YefM family antitoxin n=1 Tax=Planctomonas deserti TaxID=2144185 RepID=UPI000D338B13|nr:type II toxin-antitoxin system prevent-host-death family antitoxin [Planctomonas deserti]
MSRPIAHRDLRNSSSEVLRSVESGETIEVTNHGRVVAVLTPPTAHPLTGIGHRGPLIGGSFSGMTRAWSGEPTGDALDDLRSER